MNFLEAFKAMTMGSRISRRAWRGTVSFWKMYSKTEITEHLPDGSKKPKDNISVDDLLADDWWIVT